MQGIAGVDGDGLRVIARLQRCAFADSFPKPSAGVPSVKVPLLFLSRRLLGDSSLRRGSTKSDRPL